MRLAREYEAAEGRDLRGFLDFLAERAGRDREGEAATEAEDHDGVRVMTVHAAKGLEFPVVAVADLGRDLLAGGRRRCREGRRSRRWGLRRRRGRRSSAPRVGIRLARFGTTAVGVFGYDEMLEAAAEDEAAEACRLAYVAATRAQRLLILSGRYSARRLAQPAASDDPKPGTPITERLMRSLGIVGGEDTEIDLPAPQPRPGLEAEFTAGRLAVRFNRPEPTFFAALRPAIEPGQDEAPPTLSPPPLVRRAVDRRARGGTPLLHRSGDLRALRLPVLRGADSRLAGTGGRPRRRRGPPSAPLRLRERRPRDARMERPPRLARARGGPVSRPPAPGAPRGDPGRAGPRALAWSGDGSPRSCARSLAPAVRACARRCRSSFRWAVRWCAGRSTSTRTRLGCRWWSTTRRTRSGGRTVEELVDRYGVQRSIYALAAARESKRVRTAYVFLERPERACRARARRGRARRRQGKSSRS